MSENVPSAASQLEIVHTWLTSFVAKTNQNLGRSGPVCPLVPSAIEQKKLVLKSSDADPTMESLRALLLEEKRLFLGHLEHSNDRSDLVYAATVIALEKCATESDAKIMDQVHASLKIEFMNSGLMIGQFHPFNETSGLHNPAFRPFKCPGYCFSIRNMIPSDHVFIQQNLSGEDVPKAQTAFLQRFGDVIGDAARHNLKPLE